MALRWGTSDRLTSGSTHKRRVRKIFNLCETQPRFSSPRPRRARPKADYLGITLSRLFHAFAGAEDTAIAVHLADFSEDWVQRAAHWLGDAFEDEVKVGRLHVMHAPRRLYPLKQVPAYAGAPRAGCQGARAHARAESCTSGLAYSLCGRGPAAQSPDSSRENFAWHVDRCAFGPG